VSRPDRPPSAEAAPAIECRGLTRYYGRVVGIDRLDLTVRRGTVTGFLGPNGAGKTTVIRLLMGLLAPTAGEALLLGLPAGDPGARRRVGYLPADPAFYPHLTGRENLDLLAELGGWPCPDRAWAATLLDMSDEDLDRPVREYSSGMIQKLGLVQAVQHRPEVVVLDEPANRLDPIAHRRFEELVRAVAAGGRTVFLSSHILSEVEAVCDDVAMVRAGRLLTTARVDELRGRSLRNLTVHYSGAPANLPDGLLDVRRDGDVVHARAPAGRPDLLRALLADPSVVDVLVEPASLEETFLHLYEGRS
jgi:ABC-2 type transport system ATP-binding protein